MVKLYILTAPDPKDVTAGRGGAQETSGSVSSPEAKLTEELEDLRRLRLDLWR